MAANREKLGLKAALKKFEGTKKDKAQDMKGARKLMKKANQRGK